MEGGGNCIVRRAVWTVCKLERIECVGRLFLIFCMTNLSKHFIMIGVSAMDGSRLNRTQVISLVRTGMMFWILDMWG